VSGTNSNPQQIVNRPAACPESGTRPEPCQRAGAPVRAGGTARRERVARAVASAIITPVNGLLMRLAGARHHAMMFARGMMPTSVKYSPNTPAESNIGKCFTNFCGPHTRLSEQGERLRGWWAAAAVGKKLDYPGCFADFVPHGLPPRRALPQCGFPLNESGVPRSGFMSNDFKRRYVGASMMMMAVAAMGVASPARAAGGDFNGDGRADLAIGAPFEGVGTVANAGIVHIIYGLNAAGLNASGNQQWTQNSGGIADACEEGDQFGSALAVGDFDDDGFDDVVIGVPEESVNGQPGAGAIHVMYGSAIGIRSTRSKQFTQATAGVEDEPNQDDNFGGTLAVGDFDGDGYDDVAVSATFEDVSFVPDSGAVHIFYGSSTGLTATGNQFWSQDSAGILDECESGDRFGFSLAAGDFDGDGRDDLAIGSHLEDVGAAVNAGSVHVLYGSPSGITSTDQLWTQNTAGIADTSEIADLFGESLTAGDYNGDGYDDLIIGVPFESLGAASNCGAVHALYGSSLRLRSTGSQFWHQNTAGIADAIADNELFGSELATGDFNNDNRDDLAIGVPLQEVNAIVGAGAVHIILGSAAKLTATGSQFWHQDSDGILEVAEADLFGSALAAGDFDNDGKDDLAIGASNETIFGHPACGGVSVIYGAVGGLTSNGDQFWSQNTTGITGAGEDNDQFGAALGK